MLSFSRCTSFENSLIGLSNSVWGASNSATSASSRTSILYETHTHTHTAQPDYLRIFINKKNAGVCVCSSFRPTLSTPKQNWTQKSLVRRRGRKAYWEEDKKKIISKRNDFLWMCPSVKLLVLLYASREKFNFFRNVSLAFSGDFEHITSTRKSPSGFFIRVAIKILLVKKKKKACAICLSRKCTLSLRWTFQSFRNILPQLLAV